MAVIGTFGSFTAARMGIYAAQSALTVTGNNIANINTDGYTRQRLDLIALHSRGTARYANKMNLDMGYGVLTNGVSQLRDPFIDLRFRDEQAKMGASETWLDALQQLSLILDEVGDGDDFGIIERQFNEFFSELQQLNGAVGTPEYDTTARTSAQVLCNLLNSYSEALDRVEDNQIERLKDDVTAVNTILTRIRELSETIREGDIYGAKSLELRDERNVLIDELSKYMKIEVSYDLEKIDEFNSVERININVADTGNPPIRLVCGIYATQLAYSEKSDDDSGLNMAPMRNPKYNFDNPNSKENIGVGKYLKLYDGEVKEDDITKNKDGSYTLDTEDDEGNPITVTLWKVKDASGKEVWATETDSEKDPDIIWANNTKTGDENMEDNRAWLHLEPLVSAKGRVFKDSKGESSKRVELGDNTLQGGLQSRREFIVGKGEFSSALEISYDRDAVTTRGVPYYRYSLDALAQKFAKLFNEANQVNFTDVEKVYMVDKDKDEFVDADGKVIPINIVTDNSTDPPTTKQIKPSDFAKYKTDTTGMTEEDEQENQELYRDLYAAIEVLRQEGTLNPEYGYYNGGVLFSSSGDTNDMTGITARNITISKAWSIREVQLLNTKEPDMPVLDTNGDPVLNEDGTPKMVTHSTRDDNIAHMINMMSEKQNYFAQDTVPGAGQDKRYFYGTFQERLADMNVILSVDQQTTVTLYDCYTINSLSLDNERQSVSGVDLNDEAMNMMTFQKSYAAACQLMTTLDSMLDKLINGTI